jgi:hypothetical protein
VLHVVAIRTCRTWRGGHAGPCTQGAAVPGSRASRRPRPDGLRRAGDRHPIAEPATVRSTSTDPELVASTTAGSSLQRALGSRTQQEVGSLTRSVAGSPDSPHRKLRPSTGRCAMPPPTSLTERAGRSLKKSSEPSLRSSSPWSRSSCTRCSSAVAAVRGRSRAQNLHSVRFAFTCGASGCVRRAARTPLRHRQAKATADATWVACS